jgi:hypothetical protein
MEMGIRLGARGLMAVFLAVGYLWGVPCPFGSGFYPGNESPCTFAEEGGEVTEGDGG